MRKKLLCLFTVFSLLFTGCGGVIADAMSKNQDDATAGSDVRIAATSVACMQICEKLDLDLVAV